LRGTSVEECGGSMSEELARHEVVCLQDTLNIITPDTNSNTHDHVLRTLDNLAVDFEKV
jgi:hypothetical protein